MPHEKKAVRETTRPLAARLCSGTENDVQPDLARGRQVAGKIWGSKKDDAKVPEVNDLDRLQKALKKDLKANARSYWDALKRAVETKFGKTAAAFQAFSCASDHMMSYQQFQELCESVGLAVEPRLQKGLFEMGMKDESDVAWTLQDFQENLLAPKIQNLRAALSAHNKSAARIQGHITEFIKKLAISSGEENRRRSVERLQKKLGIGFCVELRAALQRLVVRTGKTDGPVSVEHFMKVIDSVGSFQNYEHALLRNVFDRVDRTRCGNVHMSDLIVAFCLLASECLDQEEMRMDKLKFLFETFDDDGDGCLTCEEVLRMYCSITINGCIASGDQPSYDADMVLGDELSLSKARRLYDFTLLHLQQSGVQDLCTFEELWSAFKAYPNVMEELIPGTYSNSIMWVLRPLRPVRSTNEEREEAPKRREKRMETCPVPRSGADRMDKKRHTLSGVAARLPVLVPSQRRGSVQPGGSTSPTRGRADRFRVQAAIRFRHALRGEWDVVNSLQNAPTQSQSEGWFDSSLAKLSSLTDGKSEPTSPNSIHSDEKLPQVSWADAVVKFDRRQKDNNWQVSHRQSLTNWSKDGLACQRQSLTNWSKGGLASSTRALPAPQKSQSMPDLKPRPGHPTLGSMSAAEVKVAANARVDEITNQTGQFLHSMPSDRQRFGREALTRIKHVARARASSNANGNPEVQSALTDCVQFNCHLCRKRHDIMVPCPS